MRGIVLRVARRADVLCEAQVRDKVCNFSSINCLRSQGYSCGKVGSEISGDENGGGVEQDNVAAWSLFAGENGREDGCVGLGVASDEGFGGGSGETGVLGGDGGEGDDAVVDFGDVGRAEDRDFIEAGGPGDGGFTMDDEGVAGAKLGHGFGDERDEVRGVDAHDLRGRSGRIGEWPEEIEDSANSEGATDGHDRFHGRVEARGVKERETVAAKARGGFGGGDVDGDAEGLKDVSRAALGGNGSVAVLGDCGSGGCGDERSGGGDVEGAGGVAAGAAGVDEELALGGIEGEGGGGGAHGLNEASYFGWSFTTSGEGSKEGGDLDVGELTREDLLHEVAGFFAGERNAAFDELLKVGLEGHPLRVAGRLPGSNLLGAPMYMAKVRLTVVVVVKMSFAAIFAPCHSSQSMNCVRIASVCGE
jgi:hypothetical protein